MGGEHKLPTKVLEKAAQSGGELAPNVLLLGESRDHKALF